MNVKELFLEKIANGLQRKAVTTCSKWATTYRIMGNPFPGPWNWEHHPWLYELHDVKAQSFCIQKAAQMGFTEWALNRALYAMDIEGLNVLYTLPTDKDASDFSAARFDKALELSEYLSGFFSNVKNVGHKRAASTSLYVRGSNSKSQFKSIDTALIVYDEYDEMNQKNIALASERQSGQRVETQFDIKLSTPTIEDFGINAIFKRSTQHHYFFRCPSCNRFIELAWPDSIVITGDHALDPRVKDTHLVCSLCKNKLVNENKHLWLKPKAFGGTGTIVASNSDRDIFGLYANQMYSSTVTLEKFAKSYLDGIYDPTIQTEFFNSKLGVPHAVEGTKVNDTEIIKCIKDYYKQKPTGIHLVTMGVDVGSVNHVSIEEWYIDRFDVFIDEIHDYATPKLLFEGTTSGHATDFDELDEFLQSYKVDFTVIDAEPERREAYKFASRHWGLVYLCDFSVGQAGRSIAFGPEEEAMLKVNRTSWMDVALGRFKQNRIILPVDTSEMYKKQIKEPQRVYKFDRFGNPQGFYTNINPDHFAFTRVYSEIALRFAVLQRQSATQDLYD